MRVFKQVAGAASMILAALFLAPSVFVFWLSHSTRSDGQHHSDFILSVGDFTFSGWQMWGFLSALALVGVGFIFAGVYAFRKSKPAA